MSKFGASTWRFVRSGKEIFLRNCAERKGTLTESRIFNVRKNFAKTNQTVKPNLQGSLCVKRLTIQEHKRVKEIESTDPGRRR